MKKIIIIVLTILIGSTMLTSCGQTTDTKEPTKTQTMTLDNRDCFTVWVDPDTGVNYIVFAGDRKGAMTVRYNADGSIMTSPIE